MPCEQDFKFKDVILGSRGNDQNFRTEILKRENAKVLKEMENVTINVKGMGKPLKFYGKRES